MYIIEMHYDLCTIHDLARWARRLWIMVWDNMYNNGYDDMGQDIWQWQIICVLYTISPDGHANYDMGETSMTMVNMYENMDLCTIHDRALWARREFAGPMYQGMH